MADTTSKADDPPPDRPDDDQIEEDPDIDMNIDTTVAEKPKPDDAEMEDEAIPEPKEPTKKDISLRDFLAKMDDYAPIIPDAVTSHHLLLAGLNPATTPLPLSRLLALATQKFIADIAADAYQYSRMRSSNTSSTTAAAAVSAGPGPSGLGVGAGGGGAAEGGGGGKKDDKGSKAGQHVLGVQRAGYGGGGGGGGQAGQGGRAVLTMEDLGCAVGEYGVNIKRGEFYR